MTEAHPLQKDAPKKNGATGIWVFGFELFISERCGSLATACIFFPARFHREFDCFAVVRCLLGKYTRYRYGSPWVVFFS
jgi:hypothetical protein